MIRPRAVPVLLAFVYGFQGGPAAKCPEIDPNSAWVRASRAWSNEEGLHWSNDSLRRVLLALVEQDQASRASFGSKVGDSLYVRELEHLDSVLAMRMDTVLDRFGLPTRTMVGPAGSDAAMLVIQHSWRLQERALAMARALPSGQISPEKLAMLEDRILVHQGKPQRYGTQFTIGADGLLRFAAVSDAAGLEARRAAAGMPPMDLYVCLMEESGMRIDRGSLPPAVPAAAPVDQQRAQEYFKEAQTLCERDGGRLWGVSVCAPMVIYDRRTQTIATSQPAPEGALPPQLGLVNAPITWGGTTWGAYVWDYFIGREPRRRNELLLHELFHGVQGKLGLGAPFLPSEHLDLVDGRYWLRLEWRALARALRETGDQRSSAVRDALAFRQARRTLYPGSAENERGQEITEGLAAYTATALVADSPSDAVASALDLLTTGETAESFVRTFAYTSGPAYGVLLDATSPDWRRSLRNTDDLGMLLMTALAVQPAPDAPAAATRYGGADLRKAEEQREQQRQARIAELRQRFVDGPVLIIRGGGSGSSDSRGAVVIPGAGTVFFGPYTARVAAGTLEAEKGVLLASDGGSRRVPEPSWRDETTLGGDGWTFKSSPGWVVREGPRRGDYEVLRRPELTQFEARLDRLRGQLAIPGMSAIVMRHDTVIWEGSLGFADLASQRRVTPVTQFHLASLTKTFASTIVLQLVEQGLVDLDDPVSKYGITLPSPGIIRVRHLMSHTSDGVPGEQFRYNGDRFALLDQVIQRAAGESFATRVMARIITPLGLDHTAPNPSAPTAFAASGRNAPEYIAAMATGYGIDGHRNPVPVAYPTLFSSAAGLVSTARDVARYSTALDKGQFLNATTRTLAYTPSRGAGNKILPYGLGWFISTVRGHTLVWHYGYWTGNSSLIIKEPSRGLTFVVLTNSDQLSARFRLGTGDLMSSTIAQAFVRTFVTGALGK